jgi:MazG family protein
VTAEKKTKPAGEIAPADERSRAAAELGRLLGIMARLRDPDGGCPWDVQQTFATIAHYTVEEAHEVADAIERGDMADLKDELGDLLLQVVFHARMAEEQGLFDFADVAEGIGNKMVRRHPHVFVDAAIASGPAHWDAIKEAEREAKGAPGGEPGLFDGIATGLPALMKSAKLQRRARSTGFDWPSVDPIFDKLAEEVGELRAEIDAPDSAEKQKRQFEEFGDVMFVLINLSLHLGIDAEAALRAANLKFIRRMEAVQTGARAGGRELKEMTLDEMNVLWDRAKAAERGEVE